MQYMNTILWAKNTLDRGFACLHFAPQCYGFNYIPQTSWVGKIQYKVGGNGCGSGWGQAQQAYQTMTVYLQDWTAGMLYVTCMINYSRPSPTFPYYMQATESYMEPAICAYVHMWHACHSIGIFPMEIFHITSLGQCGGGDSMDHLTAGILSFRLISWNHNFFDQAFAYAVSPQRLTCSWLPMTNNSLSRRAPCFSSSNTMSLWPFFLAADKAVCPNYRKKETDLV